MKTRVFCEIARQQTTRWSFLVLYFCLIIIATHLSIPAQPARNGTGTESVLLIVQGQVQVAKAGAKAWETAQVGQRLAPGDRLRTGARSRAEVRLSNRCVLPIDESTTFTFEKPAAEKKPPILSLSQGSFYLQSREGPQDIQFRARLVSGATRGTEFHLSTDAEGWTVLTMLDGQADLYTDQGTIAVSSGEQARVEPGKPPEKTAVLEVINIIQWTLYYPAVLEVDELELSAEEKQLLADSLTAYRSGDLLQALEKYPAGRVPASDAERIYLAALVLAVGQVDDAEALLDKVQGAKGEGQKAQSQGQGSATAPQEADKAVRAPLLAQALRRLIAAVKGQSPSTLAPRPSPLTPLLASELLAESYYQQSRGKLSEALLAAGQAAEKSPNFGFAWVRVAELEFSFGRTSKALTALEKGLQLSPRNAQALALKGFLLSARNQIAAALGQFDQAIAIDGALGNAWLGRGLCKIRQGKAEAGRQDIQTATVLEPQRAVLRSYLGKAWSNEKDNTRARQELELAKRLDPNDPTAWLYSALINQQQNRINEAIHDLEKSQELNENRRLYRSRMLLDQDRAVRGANLAGIYQDAGMFEVSVREAGRAVSSDYANYSAHLFLANSYNALRDPRQITLRYETPWLSEFLVANLLAPVGAGTLSQYISQNEYSRLFERDRIGLSSSTEYLSGGDWVQSASQFGTVGGASYALDTLYRSETGQRPNNDLEQVTFSAKLKQQITTQDSVYLQTIFYNSESGDAAQYYDPGRSTQLRLRVKETQEPMLLGGYHHEWVPGIHTLLLAGRLEDTFRWTDPAQSVLYLFKNNLGQVNLARSSPAALEYRTEFEAYTAELQQICQQEKHTSVMGARYQVGGFDTQSRLGFATPLAQDLSPDFQRLNFYGYHHWQMAEPLLLTVGLSYDRLKYPSNFRVPPITSREGTDDQVSPKAGIIWTPWKHTAVRASFTRSLGGVSYDQSFRLEPTQVAGFNQAYRSIISESVAGAMASPAFETWGVALDQKCGRGTYLTLESEWLNSEVARVIGAMDVTTTGGFPPVIVYTPSGTRQHLDYREKNLMLTVNQLLGKVWSLGAKYRLSQTELETDFPDIPLAVTPAAHTEQEAILHQVRLHTLFNHASGFFGLFESVWSSQSNLGYTPDLPGDDFWHFNVHLGYRFPRRQAEVRVGVLNLADEDYHLNPLSLYPEYRHSRTLALSCKLYF